jgi:hypothetical protein
MPANGRERFYGVPPFDVVLRGYDRRQVDERISRLQRGLDVLRKHVDSVHRQAVPAAPPPAARPHYRPGGPPREAGRPDVEEPSIDRVQAIIQAAEKEADEIRRKARAAVRAEEVRAAAARAAARAAEESARTSLAELVRQRDAALADLTRVRGKFETPSGPIARITLPIQSASDIAN